MPITDLAFPLLIGAGILLILSKQSAIVAPVDIAAAPDPVKCKAYDDSKVNSKLVGEPCSQVCGSLTVGGNKEKCANCETVCGVPNCGCFGTNQDPVCEKFGPLAEGCTNTRSGDSGDNEDNDSSDGGGGGSSGGMNAKEYTKATTPAQRVAANKKIEALSKFAYVPMNWA